MSGPAIYVLLVAMIGCGKSTENAAAGCTKDSDCKGDRICVNGGCVEGKAQAASQTGTSAAAAASPSTTRRFGYVNPPAGKDNAIARTEARTDAAEAGRIPWGTEVDVVDALADGKWFGIRYPPILGDRVGWVHRDVFKLGEHPPARRPRPEEPTPFRGWDAG